MGETEEGWRRADSWSNPGEIRGVSGVALLRLSGAGSELFIQDL